MITSLPIKIYLLFLCHDLTSTPQDKSAMPQVTHEQQLITKFGYARTLSSCSKKKTPVLITVLYSRDY